MTDGETESLAHVLAVYQGSDGDKTKTLYAKLGELGAEGKLAVELLRAQKNSERAKLYRGGERGRGSYRRMAYDRKQWALDNLVRMLLSPIGASLDLCWGWGEDAAQQYHRWVLYADLPTGQVSFHAEARGEGPDYPRQWDGVLGQSPTRICRFAARALAGAPALL